MNMNRAYMVAYLLFAAQQSYATCLPIQSTLTSSNHPGCNFLKLLRGESPCPNSGKMKENLFNCFSAQDTGMSKTLESYLNVEYSQAPVCAQAEILWGWYNLSAQFQSKAESPWKLNQRFPDIYKQFQAYKSNPLDATKNSFQDALKDTLNANAGNCEQSMCTCLQNNSLSYCLTTYYSAQAGEAASKESKESNDTCRSQKNQLTN